MDEIGKHYEAQRSKLEALVEQLADAFERKAPPAELERLAKLVEAAYDIGD